MPGAVFGCGRVPRAVGRMTTRDLTLIIELELEEEWHTYWWDAGSWGAPPRLQIMLLRVGRSAPPFARTRMHFDRTWTGVRLPQVGSIPSAAATTRCFTSRVDVPVGLVGVQRGLPVGHAIQHIECASPVAHWPFSGSSARCPSLGTSTAIAFKVVR